MGKFIDLTGGRFGDWTVLGRDTNQTTSSIPWMCKCKCGSLKSVLGVNLRRGLSKSCGKCDQIIYGFGINDLRRDVTKDPVYSTWKRMIERCYAEVILKYSPTYENKYVNPIWKSASSFETWMLSKNWEGMELDKDLLVLGNREYGPDTCWFVPKRVNLSLGLSEGKRGDYPLGVCRHNDGINPFIARSGQKYLGLFPTAKTAHSAWQKAKAEDLLNLVEWWQFDYGVNHTFNHKIAENIFLISDKIVADFTSGKETKSFI